MLPVGRAPLQSDAFNDMQSDAGGHGEQRGSHHGIQQ
jgi:hypothetical protein